MSRGTGSFYVSAAVQSPGTWAGNALPRSGRAFGLPLFDNRSVQPLGETYNMGAIAEAIAAYAQPLLDQTDGSAEQMSKALMISQLCWNLALLPGDSRDKSLSEMRPSLKMDDDEFDAFRRSVVVPMIRRHQEMFPQMHRRGSTDPSQSGPSPLAHPRIAAPAEKYPGTGRYAPCPCNSGRKYKFCCGQRRR